MSKKIIERSTLNVLLLVAFAVGIGVFIVAAPKHSDDYWYMLPLKSWFESQGIVWPEEGGNVFRAGVPFREMFSVWSEHYMIDNIRLGNVLSVFLLMFPKWVGSGLMVMCWIYCMFGTFSLAGLNWRKSRYIWLALVMWGFLMPWSDHMSSLVYQMNYIAPTALCVFFLKMLLSRTNNTVVMFFLGLIIGLWHEGFAVPLVVGVTGLMFLDSNRRNREYYAGISGICIGLACILTSPGVLKNINAISDKNEGIGIIIILKTLLSTLPYWVMVAILSWSILVKRKKYLIKDRFLIVALVSGFVPVLFMIILRTEPRVVWWTQFVSIAGLLKLVNVLDKWQFITSGFVDIIAFVLVILLFIRLIVADYSVVKLKLNMGYAISEYHDKPRNSIFVNVDDVRTVPLINIGMINPGMYTYDMEAVRSYYLYGNKPARSFMMIPERLRSVDENSGHEVPGEPGYRIIDGYLFNVLDDSESDYRNGWLIIDYGKGPRKIQFVSMQFRPKGANKDFRYVYPYARWNELRYGTINSIRHIPQD